MRKLSLRGAMDYSRDRTKPMPFVGPEPVDSGQPVPGLLLQRSRVKEASTWVGAVIATIGGVASSGLVEPALGDLLTEAASVVGGLLLMWFRTPATASITTSANSGSQA